jgi:hypothetical protein
LGVDSLEHAVRFVVGNRGDRWLRLGCHSRDEVRRRGNSIADEENKGARLEPTQGLVDVGGRPNSDAIETETLEGILEELRYSLDDNDNGRSARCRRAADLIFDERSPSEWEQGSQSAPIIFLIGSDESADGHDLMIPPRPEALSNRFRGPSKMVKSQLR